MMRIFRKPAVDEPMAQADDLQPGDWVDLVKPTQEEAAFVVSRTGALDEHIHASLDEDERSRADIEPESRLFIIRIPFKSEREGGRLKLSTVPMGVIITPTNVVTVCLESDTVLNAFREGKVRQLCTSKRTRMLLQVLSRTIVTYLNDLANIEREIHNLEAGLLRSVRNVEIIELLELQKDLVYFNTGIVGNGNVLDLLVKGRVVPLYEEDEELLDNLVVENKQCIEMVTIYSSILTSTMDAYASVVSNNQNLVLKVLTSVSIILAMPTIVASFYGMNVHLPFQEHPHAFAITVIISVGISLLALGVFARKEWL